MFRKAINAARYTFDGRCVLFGRTDLTVDESMQAINGLRRKYGLQPWELSERTDG